MRTWKPRCHAAAITALLSCAACSASHQSGSGEPALAGAWKASVQFRTGALAPVKDLQFMYVYNAGGTLSESSNYDAAPPVPPAYGTWRRSAPGRYESRYEFFTTRAATPAEAAAAAGGWLPAGHGVLSEHIGLAADGQSYVAQIELQLFDATGQPAAGGGSGTVHAQRLSVAP
jgi:hypothetical protein